MLVVCVCSQVWVGTVQRALGINSLQLMLKQMPLSAALLLPAIVLAEDVTAGAQPLVSVAFTPQLMGMIVVTACMAFFVNVSTFYIIAELSPITSRPPPASCLSSKPRFCLLFRLLSQRMTLPQLQRARPLQNVHHHRRRRIHVPRGDPPPLTPPPPSLTPAVCWQAFDVQKACGACGCVVGAFWYARLNQKTAPPAVSLDEVNTSAGKEGCEGKAS